MPDDTTTISNTSAWKWVLISSLLVVFVVGAWGLSGAVIIQELGDPKLPGTFGDMFGAVNALFSGLAFAGIIVAIMMQREDLKLQQEELTGSRKAQEAQVNALVITAQINARVVMMENSATVCRIEEDIGEHQTNARDHLQEIYQLLGEMRSFKGYQ